MQELAWDVEDEIQQVSGQQALFETLEWSTAILKKIFFCHCQRTLLWKSIENHILIYSTYKFIL